jgi:hypothetical protein
MRVTLSKLALALSLALTAALPATHPALAAQQSQQAPAPAPPPSSDYYTNSNGQRVHGPIYAARPPAGATAQCYDGSWSFSQHHQGTCSRHGGVRRWL